MKRVIVIRRDLNCRKGKYCAQAGHGVEIYWLEKIQNYIRALDEGRVGALQLDAEDLEYIGTHRDPGAIGSIKKITVKVKDSDELMEVYDKAVAAGLKAVKIVDANEVLLAVYKEEIKTVCVDSEEDLLEVHQKALNAGLKAVLVKDSGLTEFKEPTFTCVAIGPHENEKFNGVTDDLPTF